MHIFPTSFPPPLTATVAKQKRPRDPPYLIYWPWCFAVFYFVSLLNGSSRAHACNINSRLSLSDHDGFVYSVRRVEFRPRVDYFWFQYMRVKLNFLYMLHIGNLNLSCLFQYFPNLLHQTVTFENPITRYLYRSQIRQVRIYHTSKFMHSFFLSFLFCEFRIPFFLSLYFLKCWVRRVWVVLPYNKWRSQSCMKV